MSVVTTEPELAVESEGIRVVRADETALEAWDDQVESSAHGTVFHRLEALRVQEAHSGTTCHPLVGYKGQEPVGLFPVFELGKAGVSAAFSPPPNLWVSFLGPVLLNFEGLKTRRAEKRHRRFVDAALEWVETAINPRYSLLRTPLSYDDPRPFAWQGYSLTPRYTYVLDLTPGPDALLSSFSSDARRNVTNTDPDSYDVSVGGQDAIERIIRQVARRHEEQGETYLVTPEFVTDLYEALPEGTVLPYVCEADGEFVGGTVALSHGDTVHRWQGGAKTASGLPVNDLLDWRILSDAADRGQTRYNLVGANNPRLCEYKSKFGPDLVTYYSLERGSVAMRLAADVYRLFVR